MIVVEFSLSQKCFHKQTLEEMCEQNSRNIMQRNQTDYVPIASFHTTEMADSFIEKTRDAVKDYPMYKDMEGKMVVPD